MTEKSSEPLIVAAKDAYPKLRKFFVFALVIGLFLSPLVPQLEFKVAILSSLGVTLLFLFFDIYNQLQVRLASIEECLLAPYPLEFDDFRSAEPEIYKTIEFALVESQRVELVFLTVSGSYSWPFFEDIVRRLDAKFNNNKEIVVTFGLVDPNHFDSWKLLNWKRKGEVTIASIDAFKHRYRERIENGHIIVNTFKFDNLPHWHGVLIGGTTLFLGRTEWELNSTTVPELLVGQIEYRKFTKLDRFGGDKRITRFKNWVDRYKVRDVELSKIRKPSQSI